MWLPKTWLLDRALVARLLSEPRKVIHKGRAVRRLVKTLVNQLGL